MSTDLLGYPVAGLFTHADLVIRAERWLRAVGCGVTFREFVAATSSGEIPAAIGWRNGTSILVECKVSRADFLADKNKRFRRQPEYGVGDWRIFLAPPDVIDVSDLPTGWGLLEVRGRKIVRVAGVPTGNTDWSWGKAPFDGHKRNEAALMLSALRRLSLRGHLESIYERIGAAATPAEELENLS